MDTTKIERKLNEAFYSKYVINELVGEPVSSIFPRVKVETDTFNSDLDYVYADVSILADGRDLEGIPYAQICYEVGTHQYSYALLHYDHPSCSRGEVSDPGGWDVDEYDDACYPNEASLVQAMKARADKEEAEAKAEAESEAAFIQELVLADF